MSAMETLAESLAEYAALEGSELGEYLDALADFASKEHEMSPALREALLAEMQEQNAWLRANSVIEEEEVNSTYMRRVLRFVNE
jgi:DnaJ-domain-containing protein 1